MTFRHDALVGLGSNLGDRIGHLEAGVAALADLPDTVLRAASSVYDTDPVGPPQPDYLNAVVRLDTSLSPERLIDELKQIEQRVGRTPSERWGPREIDLDLLLYDDLVRSDGRLRLPHPEMHLRAFVLVPLAELDADADIPGRGRVRDLLAATGSEGVRRHGVMRLPPARNARDDC